jgi:hypothetical protein
MNNDAKRSTEETPQAADENNPESVEIDSTEMEKITGGAGPIASGASLGMD